MPLYASGGFENGDLNDRPAPPPGAPPPAPIAPPYGGQQPPPPPPSQSQLEANRPCPIFFEDAESACNWRPTIRTYEISTPIPMSPLDFTSPQGFPGFSVSDAGERYGPDGALYMLPGETPDMFNCDVCGEPGHRASSCAYKVRFPPDGHIARPDWYEVICCCGSLNISPDPPRKCNTCRCGGDYLMVRCKQPPSYSLSTFSDISNSTPRQCLLQFFRPYNPPPQPKSQSESWPANLMF